MIVTKNMHTNTALNAEATKPTLSPAVEFAIKSIAFVALCGMVATVVMQMYLVVLLTGLIAVTALAIMHLSNQNRISNKSHHNSPNGSENNSPRSLSSQVRHSPAPRHSTALHELSVEKDDENSLDARRARIAKLKRYDDKPWHDIPPDARTNNNHSFWNKYDIEKPESQGFYTFINNRET